MPGGGVGITYISVSLRFDINKDIWICCQICGNSLPFLYCPPNACCTIKDFQHTQVYICIFSDPCPIIVLPCPIQSASRLLSALDMPAMGRWPKYSQIELERSFEDPLLKKWGVFHITEEFYEGEISDGNVRYKSIDFEQEVLFEVEDDTRWWRSPRRLSRRRVRMISGPCVFFYFLFVFYIPSLDLNSPYN